MRWRQDPELGPGPERGHQWVIDEIRIRFAG